MKYMIHQTDILMQIVQRKHMHTFLGTLWELSVNVNAMKSDCTHRQKDHTSEDTLPHQIIFETLVCMITHFHVETYNPCPFAPWVLGCRSGTASCGVTWILGSANYDSSHALNAVAECKLPVAPHGFEFDLHHFMATQL